MELKLDSYEIKARLAPCLIAMAIPLVIILYYTSYNSINLMTFFPFILLSAIGIWGSSIARNAGLRAQSKLKDEWKVLPATSLLRWADSTINPHIKTAYHAEIMNRWNDLQLPDKQNEQLAPDKADILYDAAIERLIQQTHDKNKFHSIFRENKNFGFQRNFYALRWHAIAINIISIFSLMLYSYLYSHLFSIELMVSGTLAFIHSFCILFFVTKNSIWNVGLRYGRELLKTLQVEDLSNDK